MVEPIFDRYTRSKVPQLLTDLSYLYKLTEHRYLALQWHVRDFTMAAVHVWWRRRQSHWELNQSSMESRSCDYTTRFEVAPPRHSGGRQVQSVGGNSKAGIKTIITIMILLYHYICDKCVIKNIALLNYLTYNSSKGKDFQILSISSHIIYFIFSYYILLLLYFITV